MLTCPLSGMRNLHGASLLVFLTLLILPHLACAQQDQPPITNEDWEKTSFVAPSASYLSNNVYLGRKDSIALPYAGPVISYHDRNGLSLTATANFTNRGGPIRLDLLALEGGYDGKAGEHLQLGAYAGYFHYQSNSNSIRADSKGYAGGYASYENDWLTPQFELTAVFGTKTDWVAALEAEHEFDFNDDRVSLTPSAKCNAGTQHYYTAFIVTKLNKKGKTVSRNAVAGSDGFSILDYELSAPLGWNIRNWRLDVTPTYFIPLHPVSLVNGNETYQENLSSSFTMQLSIAYRFITRRRSTSGNKV